MLAPEEVVLAEISEIWRDLLQVKSVAPEDNFFNQGGDSLSATLLAIAVEERFNVRIEGTAPFEFPTLRELAAHVGGQLERSQISGEL